MRQYFYKPLLGIVLTAIVFIFAACSNPGEVDSERAAASGETAGNSAGKPAGDQIKSAEYPPVASAVANAEVKNLDGSVFKIADKKGTVILLNMWATWCGPCRAEMPALVRLHEAHAPQGFEVIGLNTDDETVDEINKFVGEMKLNYPLAWADTALQAELLKISKFPGIPQSFLIDRFGHLRGVFKGANPSDIKKMEELVGEVVGEG
ncbi:MAG: TlpA family protein disulfide reductase [Acidobacteria bacterium]|nr:TlpA family protein disulfide reductase [Acidobacteriota bacterium]MCA1607995.1 TlpA family protein disulfide reductase [Acidobacteriota bacterium]